MPPSPNSQPPQRPPAQFTPTGNGQCAEKTSALLAPAQSRRARKCGLLEKVVTVSRGAPDPREPHTGKAAEVAAEVTFSTHRSQTLCPKPPGEQPGTSEASAFLSLDSLEFGLR